MPYTVNAIGIVKSFGGHRALNHVDLVIDTGSVMALLGPNRASKTTMVRILATLVRPDAGTATVAGYDLCADPDGVKRSISLTGQFAAVDDMLTGRENLVMMARLRRLSRQAARVRTGELCAAFDLADVRDQRVSTYSGGMRRRLDLAMGMIEQPRLLFLDEPTTGLDPRSREQLWDTVRRLAHEGVTILLTTQYLEEADQLADTIAVLDHGRIVARGSADALKRSVGAEVLRLRFADGVAFSRAARCLDVSAGDGDLRTLEVPTDSTAAHINSVLVRLAAVGASAQNVSIHRPSLDDVFMSLTGSHALHPHSKEVA
jgi:ABC-2 type transport system ATP-binding protein